MNLAWPAFGWGALLLLSFAGWGQPFVRWLVPHAARSWAVAATFGLAVTIVLGGVANLFALVSPAAVIGCVATGAAWWTWHLWRERARVRTRVAGALRVCRADRLLTFLLTAFLAVVAIRFASAPVRSAFTTLPQFAGWAFNPHDDMYAYLVMPAKLLQTGHLAPDPFNARQLESSLGGMHLLTALGLAVLPFEQLHMIEESVGLVIFLGMLATLLHAVRAGPRVTALLLNLVVWSLASSLNLSSYLSSAALFAALLWLFADPDGARGPSPRWAGAVALVLAAIAALKTTNIPIAGLFTAVVLLVRAMMQRDRRIFFATATIAGGVALALSPWMIAMYQNFGTPLFPVLGRGQHWSTTTQIPADPAANIWAAFLRNNHFEIRDIAVAVVLFAVLLAIPKVRRRLNSTSRMLAAGVLITWSGGTLAMGLTGDGTAVDRYLYPLVFTGVPVLFVTLWHLASNVSAARFHRFILPGVWLLLVGIWIQSHYTVAWFEIRQALQADLNPASRRVPLATEELRSQAQRLQASVPAGAKLLARLTHPFLLNFQRNPVYVADWPGAVSPAPGLTLQRGAEALAQYLLAQGIRHVAYSYAAEANYPAQVHAWETRPTMPRWTREPSRMSLEFQDLLAELGITRRHVYDDGQVFVLDLQSYSGQLPPLRVR